MKIVAMADMQGRFWDIPQARLPSADLLLIAGDETNLGSIQENYSLDMWLGTLPYKHKLLVGGNHSLGLARNISGHTFFRECVYLQDELTGVNGLRIYGTPANNCGPYAKYWEFCNPRYTQRAYENIPECDILIVHGCPYGILDETVAGDHIGDEILLKRIQEIKPKLVVFGHCHESYGTTVVDGVTYVNAALCDERNNIVDGKGDLLHKPFTVDTETWEVAT